MFRFANTEYFYLLLIVPVLVAIFVLACRDRKRRLARLGNAATIGLLMPEASPRRVRNKFILFLAALVCLVVAAARPQFGAKLKEVKREGIEIMICVDVSNSMLAEDFEPNRLERTKYAVTRLLDGMQQDKIGVIIFAGDAYVQLPITSDYTTARNFVQQISPSLVTKQGTDIGAAITLAANSFSSQSDGSRVMILITDGENHESDVLAAAQQAAQKGIKIYTIGIGTPEGAPIEIDGDYIKDENGEIVVSKLDEESLEKIAVQTGGAYIRANAKSVGLSEIIEQINRTEKSEFTSQVFDEYNERFQYPLGAAIILLLLDFVMLARKNRLLARYNIFRRSTSR